MVEIKHILKKRIRFVFEEKLTRHEFSLMVSSFNFSYPAIYCYCSSDGKGCVLVSDLAISSRAHQFYEWFDNYFQGIKGVGPVLPPTKIETFLLETKEFSAQTMLTLALIGWILPVMPGTPFFLLAWALGWRPKNSKH